MANKMKLRCPVVVEGKYDKIRLSNLVETPIIVLGGFSVFNDAQKKALLRRICAENGLILLADSDRAGTFIRSKLRGILIEGKVYQVYTPQFAGKERRKDAPSADGLLGVEGIDCDTLRALLAPYEVGAEERALAGITKAMWYADGFSGGEGSAERRRQLAKMLDLPDNLSSGALLEAVNLTCTVETYKKAKQSL